MLKLDPTKLVPKRLEQIRGFLQYVIQTYSGFASYLIGFHMTIDGFWRGRGDNGWRMAEALWKEENMDDKDWDRNEVESEAIPELVSAVPRFREDVRALRRLMKADKPPLKGARATKTARTYYGFGNVFGSGFGATIQIDGQNHYEYGQWCVETTGKKSSNSREVNNLVEAIVRMVVEHKLRGSEIFIFTDNSTAKAAFWKGTSISEALFKLVLRLKELELDFNLHLLIVHVSGRRMIAVGVDGLSRADHGKGGMRGKDI
jgi:hypothetical protein